MRDLLTSGVAAEYLFWDIPEEQPKRADPWEKPAPRPEKKTTLGDLLNVNFVGQMAAHILARDPMAKMETKIRYQDQYAKCGPLNVWDVECNGVLYRNFRGRIYSRKIGKGA